MLEVSSVNIENELNIDFADLYEKSSLFMWAILFPKKSIYAIYLF
jgi:hypothetical protein